MNGNPYLAGVPARLLDIKRTRMRRSQHVAALWVLAMIAFFGFFAATTTGLPSETSSWWVAAPMFVLAATVALRTQSAFDRLQAQRGDVQAAEAALLDERIDDALSAARRTLATPRVALMPAFQALCVMGSCATLRGDFLHAADAFQKADLMIPDAAGFRALRRQLAPLVAAHRAYAMAAADRLADADVLIERAAGAPAYPTTRGIAVRAKLLVAAKRGEFRSLLELAAAERRSIRVMAYRDRVLVRVLATFAKQQLASSRDGAVRASGSAIHVDAELRPWLARVFPPAAALWGAM